MNNIRFFSTVLAASAAACSSPGSATFTIWGEEFIEQKIPAEEFADGWEVSFSKFLVNVGEIQIGSIDGSDTTQKPGFKVFDVHKPGPVVVETFDGLAADEWPNVGFSISRATNALVDNVDQVDFDLMKQRGYSIYFEATARKGNDTKALKWGFTTDTVYKDCEHPDFGKGLTVPSGGNVAVQLTIHGDHFFYDDLQSSEAKLRFDAIAAADKDSNGEVTLEELATVDLTTLPVGQYGVGGAGEVNTLRDFVMALAKTIGHYRGEGECLPTSRE